MLKLFIVDRKKVLSFYCLNVEIVLSFCLNVEIVYLLMREGFVILLFECLRGTESKKETVKKYKKGYVEGTSEQNDTNNFKIVSNRLFPKIVSNNCFQRLFPLFFLKIV